MELESSAVIPVAETWNLADLFPDPAAWRSAKAAAAARLDEVRAVAGTLGESAAALAHGLGIVSAVGEELERIHAYAAMRADGDTRDAAGQALRGESELLWTELSRAAAFVRPEVLAIEPERLRTFLDEEPALEPHRHFLKDLLRRRPHVLGAGEERILAEAGLLDGGPYTVFTLLHNSEIARPRLTLSSGETIEVTPAEFMRCRTSTVREDREAVFRAYFEPYAGLRGTLGQNLFQTVKSHVFRSRSRRFGSSLEASLHAENVPVGVYHNLIRRVGDALPLLHRYLRLRARALGVERVGYHDLHCPLGRAEPARYAVAEAVELMLDAFRPLGADYVGDVHRGFDQRWIDWHPRPGKKSGAYAAGPYGVHPFVLLNFQGDHDGVTTLAHELGHAMHSRYSNATQPYPRAGYAIFVAEVASTFNEALLHARMFELAGNDRARKLQLLAGYLDGLRGTLFRQTMFAEFELAIHERAESGEALTGESLDELYLGLLGAHLGRDSGVIDLWPGFAVEWAAIPHFHYDFYVYQYATGIVASTALAEAVLAGDDHARRRYLEFLASGGSDYPLALLRRAGVDLETAEPYEATFAAFARRLDQLEELLDDTGAAG